MASTSERSFLGKGKSGQGYSTLVLGNFDTSCRRVWCSYLGWTQHRILRKHFVVELRDQIVLAAFVLAPNLSQLDGFHCHRARPYSRVMAPHTVVNYECRPLKRAPNLPHALPALPCRAFACRRFA